MEPWRHRRGQTTTRSARAPTSCSSAARHCSNGGTTRRRRSCSSAPTASSRGKARSSRRSAGVLQLRPGRAGARAPSRRCSTSIRRHQYAHYALGQSLKRLGRREEAGTHLRLAVALSPESALYRDALDRLGTGASVSSSSRWSANGGPRRDPDRSADEDLRHDDDRASRRLHRHPHRRRTSRGARQHLDRRRRLRWRGAADALLRLARRRATVSDDCRGLDVDDRRAPGEDWNGPQGPGFNQRFIGETRRTAGPSMAAGAGDGRGR